MSKKPQEENLEINLDEITEDNVDSIPDDFLFDDDLDDDSLLDEVSSLLGTANPNKRSVSKDKSTTARISSEPKQTSKTVKKEETKDNRSPKTVSKDRKNKAKQPSKSLTKKDIQEFTLFMLEKAKIYEEISFHTILRKLPSHFSLSEDELIDLLEKIIEKGGISGKMTASSLKYYYNKDKKK